MVVIIIEEHSSTNKQANNNVTSIINRSASSTTTSSSITNHSNQCNHQDVGVPIIPEKSSIQIVSSCTSGDVIHHVEDQILNRKNNDNIVGCDDGTGENCRLTTSENATNPVLVNNNTSTYIDLLTSQRLWLESTPPSDEQRILDTDIVQSDLQNYETSLNKQFASEDNSLQKTKTFTACDSDSKHFKPCLGENGYQFFPGSKVSSLIASKSTKVSSSVHISSPIASCNSTNNVENSNISNEAFLYLGRDLLSGNAESHSRLPSKNPISAPSNGHSTISKVNEREKHSETRKNDSSIDKSFSLDSALETSNSSKETTIKSGTNYQIVFVHF